MEHQAQNSMGKQTSRAEIGQEKRKGFLVGTHADEWAQLKCETLILEHQDMRSP